MMRLSSNQQVAHGCDTFNRDRAAHKFGAPKNNKRTWRVAHYAKIGTLRRFDDYGMVN
jgi:hypothetical protein